MRYFNYAIALYCVIFLASCQKNSNTEEIQPLSEEHLQLIEQLGFNTEGITDVGDAYLVEEDILLEKSRLTTYLPLNNTETNLKQARVNSLISYNNQTNITVRIDNSIPSSGLDNWHTEVQQALNLWNGVTRSRIHFIYTTSSSADITIQSDNGAFGNLVLAAASWPTGGNAGPSIRINLDFFNNRTMSSSQKLYNMVHELGHCLGFRHTNWSGLGESSAIGISGTPTSGSNPDPNSVMNGNTALNGWNGFSGHDQNALVKLYPAFIVSINGFPSRLYPSDLNKPITISASCPQSGISYNWSASGGYISGSSTGSSVKAVPGSPITFGVYLIATNTYGETVRISKMVQP